jgi:hypothetical protein
MENELGKFSQPQDTGTGRCKLLQLAANLAFFVIKQTDKKMSASFFDTLAKIRSTFLWHH